MTLSEASKIFNIPIKALQAMLKQKYLSDPLTHNNINNLSFLSIFWGKERWLKFQLTHFSQKKRMSLIHNAGRSKVESYIFNRFYYADKTVRFSQVEDEVHTYYGVPKNKKLRELITTCRRQARNARYRDKKRGIYPSTSTVNK